MKFKGLNIPDVLWDYLDETEQDTSTMTVKEMIEEAEHVYSQEIQSKEDDPNGYGESYTMKQINAVKKFADKLKAI